MSDDRVPDSGARRPAACRQAAARRRLSATSPAATTTRTRTSGWPRLLDELDAAPRHRRQPAVLPVHPAGGVRAGRQRPGRRRAQPARERLVRPAGDREAVRPRRAHRAASSTRPCTPRSTSRRSSGSTTTWARTPCRTCWRCASPTRSSSRSGTAPGSTTCRSRWPRRSASAPAAASTSSAGAMRDIVQNHVLQVLALALMEPPASFDAEARPQREGQAAAGDPAAHRPRHRPTSRCAASTPAAAPARS